MPSTRRQTARNTRSRGPASIRAGLGTSTGAKRRQTKAKSKTSGIPKPPAPQNDPDNSCREKIHRILWDLVEKYVPFWLKIILEPFRCSNGIVVHFIIAVILLCYALWSFRPAINAYVSVPVPVTSILPSFYFIDISKPLRNDVSKPCHQKENIKIWFIGMFEYHKRINVFRIKGSGSPDFGRQLGVCLHDSMKQSKQDQPVDIITVNAVNVTYVMSEIFDAILALCDCSLQRVDCIRQIKEELDFKRDLFPCERNISKTDNVLKVLFRNLDELFKQRNSFAVMIFYYWRDQLDIQALFGHSEISMHDLEVN